MNRADARAGEHRDERLRHHRHVEDDAVAAHDAEIGEHAGERLHFIEELRIGEPALLSRHRRIVDDGRLGAAAAQDMAIDGVEAGVADGADVPAAIDAGRGIEHLLRLLVPVDGLGRLAPERDGITQRALINVVITGRAGARRRALSFAQADLPRFSRRDDRHDDGNFPGTRHRDEARKRRSHDIPAMRPSPLAPRPTFGFDLDHFQGLPSYHRTFVSPPFVSLALRIIEPRT